MKTTPQKVKLEIFMKRRVDVTVALTLAICGDCSGSSFSLHTIIRYCYCCGHPSCKQTDDDYRFVELGEDDDEEEAADDELSRAVCSF